MTARNDSSRFGDHGQPEIHRRACHDLEDEGEQIRQAQQPYRINAGPHQHRRGQIDKDILELLQVAVLQDFIIRDNIDHHGDEINEYETPRDPDDAHPRAGDQDKKPDPLFQNIQLQEQSAPSACLDHAVIDKLRAAKQVCGAPDLQINHARQPFLSQQHLDKRFGRYDQPDQDRGYEISADLKDPARDMPHLGLIVIAVGQRREEHGIDRRLDQPHAEGGERIPAIIISQILTGVHLSDQQASQARIYRVDQADSQDLPAVAVDRLQPLKGKLPCRSPSDDEPEADR